MVMRHKRYQRLSKGYSRAESKSDRDRIVKEELDGPGVSDRVPRHDDRSVARVVLDGRRDDDLRGETVPGRDVGRIGYDDGGGRVSERAGDLERVRDLVRERVELRDDWRSGAVARRHDSLGSDPLFVEPGDGRGEHGRERQVGARASGLAGLWARVRRLFS